MTSTSFNSWNRFEGVDLAGQYGIQELLGESGNAAFFRIVGRPDAQPALLKLIPGEEVNADRQLDLWRRIARLSHPNLLPLLDFGRTEQGEDSFLYAVFELPDDTLANALQHAPLNEKEAREVREAVSEALRYIQSQGFVHTGIDPGHIVAVGNEIKLSSDSLADALAMHTPSQDLRLLNALLPEVEPQPGPETVGVSEASRLSFPFWVYAALAVLVGGLWYLFLPKRSAQLVPNTVSSQARATSQQQLASQPQTARPAPDSKELTSTKPAVPDRQYWRVIAYTYSSLRTAERRADTINQKWPDANAEVFTPDSGGPPFLVALGGQMDRDAAVRLLKIARGKGLPRDTYIQNYSR